MDNVYFGCPNCPKKVEEGVDEYFCCRFVRTQTALSYHNVQNNYYIMECTIKVVKNDDVYFACPNCPKKVEEGVDEYFCCRFFRTETALRY
ncbi:hypothetical protein LINPERPRIM_LOCUS25523 [Linum perenne]